MRSVLSGLIALALLSASSIATQRLRDTGVDPRTYTSPSGEYALFVDPSVRNGLGPATYRLSHGGVEQWTAVHPFTWKDAVVCDDGSSAGYAYTVEDESRRAWRDFGQFEVAVLDDRGVLRNRHTTPRTESEYLDGSPNPRARGILLLQDRDRIFVRIADADVNRQSEAWWPYSIATGLPLAPFRPKSNQANAESLTGELAAVRIRGTPLVLVQWMQFGPYIHGRPWRAGTRFALVDEQGGSVWDLDLPDEYSKPESEELGVLLEDLRGRTNGAIVRHDEARRFELQFFREPQYVTFEVLGGGANPWEAREVARRSAADVLADVDPAHEVETVEVAKPLALVDTLALETLKTPPPFVRNVVGFAFDAEGNVAILRSEHEPARRVLTYADPRGSRIAEHELPMLVGEHGLAYGDIEWLRGEEFLVGWRASSGHGGNARVHSVSARTGASKLLVQDIGYELRGLASFGDGRFVALGDNRLDAFDADGQRLWKLTSADGLCGADHVAVLSDGRVVVSDRAGIQWITAQGKLGRYAALKELWGHEPRYLCGLAAGPERGLLVRDYDRHVRTDAGGKRIEDVLPRFRDGYTANFRDLRMGPGGRLWTSDGHAILGLAADGAIDVVIGEAPSVPRLDRVACIALDGSDRIHAVAERTGDVHVIDVEKGVVRVLRPPPGTFRGSLSFVTARVLLDDAGNIVLWNAPDRVSWGPDGSLLEVRRNERGDDSTPSRPQPGTKNGFAMGANGLELHSPTGAVVARFDRKPDGQWLKSVNACVAPDGSVAFVSVSGDDGNRDSQKTIREIVLYGADGSPRAQIPLATDGVPVSSIAYDGSRVVALSGERLHVHDIASGRWSIHPVPAIEGRDTTFWEVFLPRTHAEVWLFDRSRTVRRYMLPRGG